MRHARLLSALLALALGVASWLFVHRGLPWQLWSGDAMEYAVMARQLARGEGFTTRVIFPAELSIGELDPHPATVRPPLWPLAIAPCFALLGAHPGVVHGLVLLCWLGTLVAATALATRLAGVAYGGLTALAVATSSQLLVFVFDGAAEPLFTLLVTATFLLLARGGNPLAPGVTAGLAYLARYNGLALLPALLGVLAVRERRLRPVALGCAGFALVAVPWWVRNWLVSGDPFLSLLSLNLYMSPDVSTPNSGLLYMLTPDLGSDVATTPLAKLRHQLPELVASWPLASASPIACLGIALGCIRRDLLCWAFALLAAGTTLGIALVLPMGRYFMPLLPAALALGVASWARFGGRLRVPALALLLLAPVLPEWPRPMHDTAFLRAGIAATRQARRDGHAAADADEETRRLRGCLGPDAVALAQNAAAVAWRTGAVAIYRPASAADFWTIVDERPVTHVKLRHLRDLSKERLESRFRPRPDCAPDLYERIPD